MRAMSPDWRIVACAMSAMSIRSNAERRQVHLHHLFALACEDVADARFEPLGPDAQHRRGGAQQHHVGRTGRCRGPGQGVGIERHRVRQGVQFALQGLGVGVVGDVDHRNRVGDDPSVGRQPRQVAQRLHRFERDDEVGLAPRDEVRMDRRRGDAQVRLHVAAPLAHAVDLGLLQLQPFGEGRPSDDGGDGEDALSSDS